MKPKGAAGVEREGFIQEDKSQGRRSTTEIGRGELPEGWSGVGGESMGTIEEAAQEKKNGEGLRRAAACPPHTTKLSGKRGVGRGNVKAKVGKKQRGVK